MENYRCIALKCDKCSTCGHYNVKKFYDDIFIEECIDEDIAIEDIIIEEDLSDICLPEYRLYSDTDGPYQVYPCKEEYQELFDFYDNECDGEICTYQKDYKGIRIERSSCIECKLGDHITCKNPNHPSNKIIEEVMKCFWAENKAFEEAGITEGIVTYTCPICGGQAVANRYLFDGSQHGLGSGCKTCGTWHT